MFSQQLIDDHNVVPELDSASDILRDGHFSKEAHFSRMFGTLFVQPITVPIGFEDKVGIQFPTPLPLFENPLNGKAAEQWVASHAEVNDSRLKSIAQKFIDNIHYVNFEDFLVQLTKTVSWFNANVKDPYVLWIPQERRELLKGCSDIWVAGLAIEHANLRLPHAVIDSSDLLNYLSNNPTIKIVLALDDAAYSGNHLCDELRRIGANKSHSTLSEDLFSEFDESYSWSSSSDSTSFPNSVSIYVGVPFATENAKERIASEFSHVVHLIEGSCSLKIAKNFLASTDLAYLSSINIRFGSQTSTYFDHRFPDAMSTVEFLEDGRPINFSGKEPIRFIPQIISPYRLHGSHTIAFFRDTYHAGKLGNRTEFNPPKRYKEVLDILYPSSGTTLPVPLTRSKSLPIVSKWTTLLASCETEPQSKVVEKITRFFLFQKPNISKLPMKYRHSDGMVQAIRPVSGRLSRLQ
jgi:hypothetical protein